MNEIEQRLINDERLDEQLRREFHKDMLTIVFMCCVFAGIALWVESCLEESEQLDIEHCITNER